MNIIWKGLILLVLAAFAGELIEFLINMTLARQLGEAGIGVYMSILPTIFFIVIIASLELPVSVSKYVAEHPASTHKSMLTYAFRLACIVSIVLIIGLSILFVGFPHFLFDEPALKWMLLAMVPIVAFTSVARGYLLGIQQMQTIAFSNLLRKAVQLALLIFVYQLFSFPSHLALWLAFGAFLGSELFVAVYLLLSFLKTRFVHKSILTEEVPRSQIRSELLAISVPTTGLRLFHAFTHAVQPFLITYILMNSGLSKLAATEQFGLLAGVALTIGFFPAFIAHSLLTVLIPNVAEAHAKGEQKKLVKLFWQVMGLTLLYGVPAIFLFTWLAEPLTKLFFHSSEAAYDIKLLWPYFLFHFFLIPLQGFLIGFGYVRDAFMHTFISTAVAFASMYLFGQMLPYAIDGIIVGMNTGAVLHMLLHLVTVIEKLGITQRFTRSIPN
ncbi:oligosaccharide flippase family protein [Bacillus fonticola]|uniref:oligosaccharide flippase family protein n=1 Tax=Bacillus fonticola TaxID=2728853 RepID=UPI001474161C|nr:oligosaccharide flippase family protein [Bacillus fonticola]